MPKTLKHILIGIFFIVFIVSNLKIVLDQRNYQKNKSSEYVNTDIQPSQYDLDLQKEGILDKNFKYTNSPKVNSLYQQATSEINKNTPIDLGDGVQMIQAIKLPSVSGYTYKLPITKDEFNEKIKNEMLKNLSSIKSIFCNQANKHAHFRVNNMSEKYIYIDKNNVFLIDFYLQANQC